MSSSHKSQSNPVEFVAESLVSCIIKPKMGGSGVFVFFAPDQGRIVDLLVADEACSTKD